MALPNPFTGYFGYANESVGGNDRYQDSGAFLNSGNAKTFYPAQKTPSVTQTNQDVMMFPKGEDVKPYSGLPESYRDMLLGFVMPQMQEQLGDMSGNIDTYTQQAQNVYRTELQNALKEMIPQQIGNLANRGILNSSMAENVLSQTFSDAATRSATKGYETAMQSAMMKTQIPNTLINAAGLGRFSEDPTVMYRTLAGILQSMT